MKQILACLILVFTASCSGYSPLYRADSGAAAGLASVQIAPITDRLGQQVRGHLQDRMLAGGNARYELVLKLDSSARGFGIRPDAAATQEEVTLTGTWSLVDLTSGDTILQGTERAGEAFDLVLSDFANMTQREDTERRLALVVADEVHLALAAWFARQSQAE